MTQHSAPLVVHIIHRLQTGGLENGLVNLINRIPANRYRHTIICMTDYTDFSKRIQRNDVEIYSLNKREGKDFGAFFRLWKLLRKLKPDIVYTRNLSALEGALAAVLAGVKKRVHGEHGRDVHDIAGKNWKYNLLRRFCQPFIHQYIAVSKDLAAWLVDTVNIPQQKIVQIYNGVDCEKFSVAKQSAELPINGFLPQNGVLIGTVGRMETVKDQLNLTEAFIQLLKQKPHYRKNIRLALIGDGSLLEKIQQRLEQTQLSELVWMPGGRDDVPSIMQSMAIFVLPSLAEGVSNTILEAMSCGISVIATRVGGNVELVVENVTGQLVPPDNPKVLATAIDYYLDNPGIMHAHGKAARARIENAFAMDSMVENYLGVYDDLVSVRGGKQ